MSSNVLSNVKTIGEMSGALLENMSIVTVHLPMKVVMNLNLNLLPVMVLGIVMISMKLP